MNEDPREADDSRQGVYEVIFDEERFEGWAVSDVIEYHRRYEGDDTDG